MPGKELKNITKKVLYLLIALSLLGFFLGSRAQNVFAQDADTPTPSATEEPPAEIPSETPAPSDTPVPSDTLPLLPTETPTPTLDFSPTAGDTELNTDTPTPTLDLTQSSTPTETETETPTPTETGTLTETLTETPTGTAEVDCAALDAQYADLCAQAQENGSVRVIVQVDAPNKNAGAIDNAQTEVLSELPEESVETIHTFDTIPFMALEVSAEAVAELAASDNVVDVKADQILKPSLDVSIPLIGADRVQAAGYKGEGQMVAILDTGVDNDHPFLAGSVISEACYSSQYPDYGIYSLCHSFGWGSFSPNSADTEGCNFYGPFDCSHGTHVAGIAAGGTSSSSFSGVAPNAYIIAIQVFSGFEYFEAGSWHYYIAAFDSDIIAGLERVYALRLVYPSYPISSVNLSLGGGVYASSCDTVDPAMTNIINNLRNAGIATIIASGNSGNSGGISFPACISSAIAVGATNDADSVAGFSNSGSQLDLLAPGVDINSSVPGGGFDSWNGTSMAAPHVTGAWALYKQLNPGNTAASVASALSAFQSTGVQITDPRNGLTRSRIQVDAAVGFVDLTPPAAPSLTLPADNFISRGAPLHTWSVPTGTNAYHLQYDEDGQNFSTPVYDSGTISTASHTPTPFTQLGNFDWRVRARDLAGNWSAWSTVRSIQIIAPLPVAPLQTGPAAAALTNDNTPDFSWNAVNWGDTYEVQIDNVSTFASPDRDFTGGVGVLGYTADPALGDGLWYWRVRAFNVNSPAEPGAWSAARAFTVDTIAPLAPAQSKPLDNSVQITTIPKFEWLAALTATQYRLQVSDMVDFSHILVDQTTNLLTYTLTAAQALDPDVSYWRVQAADAAGNWGAWSAIRQFTISLLSLPVNNTFSTDTTPLLQWLPGAGALQYNVQLDNNSDFSSPEVDQNLNALSLQVGHLSYALYYWRVAVQTAGGWTVWTAPWSLTLTPAAPAAPALTSPANALLSNDPAPDFSWASVADGDTYEIQFSGSSTFASILLDVTGSSGVTIYTDAVLPDGVIYWRVRAKNIYASPGAWSLVRTFTLDRTAPLAPVITAPADNFTARTTAPMHSWTAAATATQYQLQYFQDGDDMELIPPVYDSGWFAGTTRTPAFNTLGSYDWRLRARDAAGNMGVWTTGRSLRIKEAIPAAPVLVTPLHNSITTDNTPTFTWQAVPWAVTYEIQLDNTSTFASPEYSATGLTGLSQTSSLVLNGTYYWRVRAVNALSEPGPWSVVRILKII